ncbi:hypothetical protein GJ744_006983 [Endocarpon pusillum]|uniref:Uncharacterized protein n=1 Tax=Endocarpon pusillum TaxID=364733 RepID=A0A8H7A7W4_9EURO|nr:hypothetical protein GJ744_006983 [Endocarpon pusillum]
MMAHFGIACRGYKEAFPSNNQLHNHLNAFNAHAAEGARIVLDLSASPKEEQLEGIANSTETRVKAYQNIDSSEAFSAVIDSGFGRSAVNRQFLYTLPHTTKAIKELMIRGISGRQAVSELATFVFYLRSNHGVYLKLRIAALIFDDLGIELLVGTDYIKAWNMVLDIPRQLAIF